MTATDSAPVSEVEEGPSLTPNPRRRLLKIALALLVVLGGAYLVWRQREDLATAVHELSPARFAVAGVLAVVGTMLIGQTWVALLHGMGIRPSLRDSHSVFYVSQLGKYLPGSVWPVVAQMQFGLRWGVARRTMLGANILFMGVIVASGIGVGALLLPWSSPDGLSHYWWLLLLLVPLAICLHPRVVPGMLDWLFARVGREPLGVRLTARGLFTAIGWAVLAWVALGLHLAVMMQSYASVGLLEVAAAIGGMALAWAAGIAFIPAPAGAGIREALLALTLGPIIGAPEALTVALASRVLLLVADVVLAALGAVVGRRAIG
ncbi:lysylphosphatidylglycerol synthase domain-containing protein [Nocardioides sp. CCNWLW239]|uniref:lysylphosphatidylglycerol synthase domain-containing protein n=1 Tax=Nocardioides sp. CCNWLW239 TaxID=3128902 RepID=UPI00301AD9B6